MFSTRIFDYLYICLKRGCLYFSQPSNQEELTQKTAASKNKLLQQESSQKQPISGMNQCIFFNLNQYLRGAQWFRGRVLKVRSRGCWFELQQRHCVVTLSKTLYPLLISVSTQEVLTQQNNC